MNAAVADERQTAERPEAQPDRASYGRLRIRCPNCGEPSKGDKTRHLSALTTEVSYFCPIDSCGAGFVVTAEVSRYIRLPTVLNPSVNVPLSPIVERRSIAQALENMSTAKLPPEGEIVTLPESLRQSDLFAAAHGP